MNSARRSRRAAIAFGLSSLFHVVILALVLSQASPVYDLPETVAPPMDVRIEALPEPIPRIVVPPIKTPKVVTKAPLKTPTPTPTPPASTPPTPAPVKPAPTPPTPVLTPKLAPAPPVAPKSAPVVTPKPLPVPVVAPQVATPQPAPPTPAKTPSPPAAAAPPSPIKLNVHKPEKEAPNSVATLPFAPAPTPASPAGQPPTAAANGAEPPLGGSRLLGLTPYPHGAMPSGGGGLRGSLVGCANADAVNLTSVERARCEGRFGASIGSAPALDGINPAKRAEFDKAADAQERDRRYRESAPPPGTERGAHGFGGQGPDEPYKAPLGPH